MKTRRAHTSLFGTGWRGVQRVDILSVRGRFSHKQGKWKQYWDVHCLGSSQTTQKPSKLLWRKIKKFRLERKNIPWPNTVYPSCLMVGSSGLNSIVTSCATITCLIVQAFMFLFPSRSQGHSWIWAFCFSPPGWSAICLSVQLESPTAISWERDLSNKGKTTAANPHIKRVYQEPGRRLFMTANWPAGSVSLAV